MRLIPRKFPVILLPALIFLNVSAPAQTTSLPLFTVDGRPVGKEDFLKAYNKNNNQHIKPTETAYHDYLELYIRYKLKVRAAYDMQLDTLASQKAELQNFRNQVIGNYMLDEESVDKMVSEAFAREQKDIHLAHIFIAVPKNAKPADTLRAYEKAMNAYTALKRKKSFSETALAYSEDPAVRRNHGDIGYITAFTLPYGLENLAYSTPPGQFSKPYRSHAGYHIFKNLGERKALGKMKAAQILLAIPPGASDAIRESIRLRADSIYDRLIKGDDFAEMAKKTSSDNLSYQQGGALPEFGVGKYDSVFETTAFGLQHDGEISRPVLSDYGYHMIRRIARIPVPHELDAQTRLQIRQAVIGDQRIEVSRTALLEKIYKQGDYEVAAYPVHELWILTDSAARNRALTDYGSLHASTVLFSFAHKSYDVKEWLDYLQSLRNAKAGVISSDYPYLFDQFTRNMAMDYYRLHLEDFNKDFAYQLNEFREGNLLFEIMQRKVWDKASTDSAGLRNYYETHPGKYWWDASADAILFTCNNAKIAEGLRGSMAKDPSGWKRLSDSAGASVQADSGRFELTQIPSPPKQRIPINPGQLTPAVANPLDHTVSFAYILDLYPQRSPRNFKDARGFVINDYQVYLEDEWIKELKKKYPVVVEEKVFASLPK